MVRIFNSNTNSILNRKKMYTSLAYLSFPAIFTAAQMLPMATAMMACPAMMVPAFFCVNRHWQLTNLV